MSAPRLFDEGHAARYDDQFRELTPLRDALHLVTQLALTRLPAEARVLSVGAGTGAELLALAPAFPGWRFTAVDTSAPMLARCRERVEAAGFGDRCSFHHGPLQSLPEAGAEPFDGATMILVSQFLVDRERRRQLFADIASRLRPGAPLVVADLCADALDGELADLWKQAWRLSGASEAQLEQMTQMFGARLSVLPPRELEDLIASANFDAPTRCFQTLFIHGWVARRRR
ncbi:Methyltransferase type 11 [Plesiocystis pacifica SIR-1]|uniref:Methyltransferase type 11 n=1 Tax=Plesiocystis pacifica SIR-1 TaxID=391625 RepID=A6GEC6_9BACT|nr:class I SAM-dependent methyltransferase [Plesiocystis pacifica]EDM75767.1 Methyltransferase type 11 [Plesiocystis pacifica SIR-1]